MSLTIYPTPATGDVVGPASSTDNAVARYDGTTGKLLQNSAVIIADTTGVISGTQGVTLSGSTSGTTAVVATAIAGSTTVTFPATTGTVALIAQTITNGVTTSAPSQDAVFDALALKQASLTGTFNLANFTDPGNTTPSAAMGGAIGVLIFGTVSYTPHTADSQGQNFEVETAIASGVFAEVCRVSMSEDAGNLAVTIRSSFMFFVPTGRKWQHNQIGTGAVETLSAITL